MRIISVLWAQPRTLITGGLGQLGRGLAKLLRLVCGHFTRNSVRSITVLSPREKHGRENVILSDIIKSPSEDGEE